jgi:CheY-like chemotaxis protein
MKDLIEWLIKIEILATELYSNAALFFRSDGEFASFLRNLASDEDYHHRVMESAMEVYRDSSSLNGTAISLDEGVKAAVERPLLESRLLLDEGGLTKDYMMERILDAEFSEWNDIFLYVVNSLKDSAREFQQAAAQIQRHKASIERQCEEQPACAADIGKIRGLGPLWKERILVVDDSEPVVRFLASVCEKKGIVDTASNGREALEKAERNYYDLVISDIDMPVMNGIRFYEEASRIDPGIGRRFLFFSGSPAEDYRAFLEKHRLRLLPKPALIGEIQKAIAEIMP